MPSFEEVIEDVKQMALCVSRIRRWAYGTTYGFASHEVLDILRSFGFDRYENEDPPPLPAERQFDRMLFWREDSIEQVKILGEIFQEAVVLLNHLQQPAHTQEEFEWHQENRPVFNSLVRDIVMSLTGKELPGGWLDWEELEEEEDA
jgi:hypothetical protein